MTPRTSVVAPTRRRAAEPGSTRPPRAARPRRPCCLRAVGHRPRPDRHGRSSVRRDGPALARSEGGRTSRADCPRQSAALPRAAVCRCRLEGIDRGLAALLAAAERAGGQVPIRPGAAQRARQREPGRAPGTSQPVGVDRGAAAEAARGRDLVERVDELRRQPARSVLRGGVLRACQRIDGQGHRHQQRRRDDDPGGDEEGRRDVVGPARRVRVGPPRRGQPQRDHGRADGAADRRDRRVGEDLVEDFVHRAVSVRTARHRNATAARRRLADF